MSYIEGFVLAVPAASKEAYRTHAAAALPMFKEFGATRMVETWGDDVPDGKLTDFKGAVKANPDEVIVFSWIEYPSKAARDAANVKIMSDPRMEEIGKTMPFDPQRMIWGGFSTVFDDGAHGAAGYVDGALVPVASGKKDAFLTLAARQAAVLREHGASRVVDAWGDDVPDGKITDFKGAVKATDGETVVYSWVEWPSKAVRDAAWPKIFADPRMHPGADGAPQDMARMVHGGFAPILDA